MKVNVIIRVYNRVEDLRVCLECVRRLWPRNEYHVIVAFNGKAAGFSLPEDAREMSDEIIEIAGNAGHHSGNSQLLLAGIERADDKAPYTVLLEADTWVLSDRIIDKYIRRLQSEGAVWASADWVEKVHSVALDFAVADTKFLKNNLEAFDFDENKGPESAVCRYMRSRGMKHLFLKEAMPVHIPKLMGLVYRPAGGGRRKSFSEVPMVTQHIEDVPRGIMGKKTLANIAAGSKISSDAPPAFLALRRLRLKAFESILKTCPRSAWFKAKK